MRFFNLFRPVFKRVAFMLLGKMLSIFEKFFNEVLTKIITIDGTKIVILQHEKKRFLILIEKSFNSMSFL